MRSFFETMPKIELHLHLEGAIPLPALWRLIQKYGGDPTIGGIDDLERRFTFTDFPHFIDTWIWKSGFLREYQDFTLIAEEVARDLARQNIHYVEAFYSPGDYAESGLDPVEITRAVARGLDRCDDLIQVTMIADLNRNLGPERGMEMLEGIAALGEPRVIGIGIGGLELGYPPKPYQAVYQRARELGLHTTAHAGEGAPADYIWQAVRLLEVERVGHGTRAVDDPQLMAWLKKQHIHLETCPISNLRTGVVSKPEELPVRTFFDQGISISINTDDPKMFNNTLVDEMTLLHEQFDFGLEELVEIQQMAIAASWANSATKQKLRNALNQWLETHCDT